MNLDTFLHDLHFHPDKLRPPDWQVDWDNAPAISKIYDDFPIVPLSYDIPLSLENYTSPHVTDLQTISFFLWYVYGLTQICQIYDPQKNQSIHKHAQMIRRFAPSGGALYPNELYIYLKVAHLSQGLYYYDVAHHRLILLREGNFDHYMTQALGYRCDVTACCAIVFISTVFEKNFFKYHNFSYRLHGLDTGVLMGQLLEVAKRFDFESGVFFQFLDSAVNHLLGLNEQEESTYSIIPLSKIHEKHWFAPNPEPKQHVEAADLCNQIPPIRSIHQTHSSSTSPMIRKITEASSIPSTRCFRQTQENTSQLGSNHGYALTKIKPDHYDFLSVCQQRYSPGMDFAMKQVEEQQLAQLLQETSASYVYRNDLDMATNTHNNRVSLSCCLYNVNNVPNGVYLYDRLTHMLSAKRLGDYRASLQQAMSVHNINMYQVPLCFHIIGEQHHLKSTWGYRGYRIQQMEAGMLLQRLLLVASSLNLGGHPLLGFDAKYCDEIYQINETNQTCLIQIPVGPYHRFTRLSGNLHG